ncbi:unnamed protein product, partial [Pocillopora meandrina]
QRFRSPCLDAHHEAFILRSTWTIGNLYASNLNLGQSYIKQVKDLERQRKVWLSRKEKEQDTMLRRWEALKKQTKHSYHSNSLSEVKDSNFEHKWQSQSARRFRQRAATVATSSEVRSLESIDVFAENCRSTSQPEGSAKSLNARFVECAFASNSHSDRPLLRRSMTSFHQSGVKSLRNFTTEFDRDLAANNSLLPKWLPSNLRSKNIRGKSFIL